jgi:hypothetical protein
MILSGPKKEEGEEQAGSHVVEGFQGLNTEGQSLWDGKPKGTLRPLPQVAVFGEETLENHARQKRWRGDRSVSTHHPCLTTNPWGLSCPRMPLVGAESCRWKRHSSLSSV